MSDYTAETPARCPKCGGALTERTGRSMGEVVYMYDCDHCDWDDEYARADRLTVATAPWSRDLWAEVQRLTAERDALRAAAADREHPLHFAVRMADAYYRENGRGAAELDAANLAWTQAGCPLEVEINAEDMARVTAERDDAQARADRLRRTLAVVLACFTARAHLGEAGDCLRTGWVQARTVDTWRKLVEVTRA